MSEVLLVVHEKIGNIIRVFRAADDYLVILKKTIDRLDDDRLGVNAI